MEYENKNTKGKIDKTPLLKLVEKHCESYLEKEVLPYRSGAWIDHNKIKVGLVFSFLYLLCYRVNDINTVIIGCCAKG
ncbi:hypothetical protein KJ966_05745 [bacterium]|nr:hypothetical protein [bacterium]